MYDIITYSLLKLIKEWSKKINKNLHIICLINLNYRYRHKALFIRDFLCKQNVIKDNNKTTK